MRSWADTLRFAFQPVANLATRGVAGLEILARPETGDILAEARRDPELGDQLVVLALRAAVRRETSLPLHVNVFAGTLAEAAVGGHDRRGTAYPHVPHQALLEALTELRGQGFRISADGVRDGDVPLRLLVDMSPELAKLDASLPARPSAVRAMRTLCDELGALLCVEGVATERQYGAPLSAGAQLAQGTLFAPPSRLPVAEVYVPPRSPADTSPPRSGPSVREFVRPAALLPATASAGQVRALPTGGRRVGGLLVGRNGVPFRSVHRSRFLPPMSAATDTPCTPNAPPRISEIHHGRWGSTPPRGRSWTWSPTYGRDRTSDDVAVVDRLGRCVGVVLLADLVRAPSETRVEEAAGLNPLTWLPGSDAITVEVDRRIAAGRTFALSRLDVDRFKQVNDGAGFAAGDELIRAVGRLLQHTAARTRARGAHRRGRLPGADGPGGAGSAGRRRAGRALGRGRATRDTVPGHRGVRARQRGGPQGAGRVSRAAEEGREGAQRGESGVGRAGLPGHEIRRAAGAKAASTGYAVAEPGRG